MEYFGSSNHVNKKVFQRKIYHQIITFFKHYFFFGMPFKPNERTMVQEKNCFQVRYKNNNSCSSIPQSATPSVKKKVEDMRIREKYCDQILLISREAIKVEKRKSFRFYNLIYPSKSCYESKFKGHQMIMCRWTWGRCL